MSTTLTGRTRYRIQSRLLRQPLLVLQVQEKREWGQQWDPIDGEYLPAGHYWKWRDAGVEDLSELHLIELKGN